MQVKRFVAANMRQALKMVREEMGADAIILSNKRVAEGVELLISLDELGLSEATTVYDEMPSRVSKEVERKQLDAKRRAEELAATMSGQSRQQLEASVNTKTIDSAAMDEALKSNLGFAETSTFSASFDTELGLQSQSATSSSTDTESRWGAKLDRQFQFTDVEPAESKAKRKNDESQREELSDMRFELQSMRDLLEQQFKSMAWDSYSKQKPEQASLWKRLKRMGIGANVAESLVTKSEFNGKQSGGANQWQRMMKGLAAELPVIDTDLVDGGGVFAFVGPTGAGKTTTIGKLAARYVLNHGADDVALVTTDTLRIAGHEQLRTFGRILNVPVKVVDKNNSLERVLYSLRHKSLVLIDTAGMVRHDDRLKQQADSLNEAGNRLQSILVLPTTSQVAVIRSAFHTYATDNLAACVLTKLDESASLGETLTLAIEKDLPVAYTTYGQGIPDDIAVSDAMMLVQAAIELAKHTKIDNEAVAELFGAASQR